MTFWIIATGLSFLASLTFLAMTIFGKNRWPNLKAALLFGVVTFLLPIAGALTSVPSANASTCGSPYAASMFAQRAVEESLKSPSSAQFSNVQAHPDGECRYLVAGRVEAQNGFGAMIANNFSALIEFDPADNINWTASDVLVTPR